MHRQFAPIFLLALTTSIFATDPRIVDRGNERIVLRRMNELELMESGLLPHLPPFRATGPTSETSSNSFTEQDLRLLELLDKLDPDLPGPSSPRQRIAVQQQRQEQRLEELRLQQQEDAALTIPPISQHMSLDVEPATPSIPSPVEALAPYILSNSTFPPRASGTGTPSQAQCLQCIKSCLGCVAHTEEALSEYCNAGTGRCACGEQGWECALSTTTCCSIMGGLLGGMALLGVFAAEASP